MSVYSENVEISNFKPRKCANPECNARVSKQGTTGLCRKCFNALQWKERKKKTRIMSLVKERCK